MPGERKVAIAVDLSAESANAVRWAVENYIRPDWGPADHGGSDTELASSKQKLENDFDEFTSNRCTEVSKPLDNAKIPYKIHLVKDHDMKERICLEVERMGADVVIMGSRGFGAEGRTRKALLGSVSDYCVHHCDCPVVVVRMKLPVQEN